MPKKSLTEKQIEEIVELRKTGHSLTEIKQLTHRSAGSIFKYIQGVTVLPEYKEILKVKQGGSKERAREKWEKSKEHANHIIGNLSDRDILIFIAGLYWGEGSKSEFNLINGDPYLIKTFIRGLNILGIDKSAIRCGLRMYTGMDKSAVINFWKSFLDLNKDQIGGCEVVKGNGSQKLKYGMCRIRVKKGADHFKLIMSMIDLIKLDKLPS